MKVRSCEVATESDCFFVVIGQEVGALMVSMVPVAVLVPIFLHFCFYHGCWDAALSSLSLWYWRSACGGGLDSEKKDFRTLCHFC